MSRLLVRGRSVAVLLLLLAAALGVLSATQPWGSALLTDGRALAVTGQELASGVTIMSLSLAVLALVLPIAGIAWRFILGALAAILGAGLIAHVLGTRGGILAALDARVAEATGIAGSGQAAEIVELAVHGWPALGVASGAIAIAAGLWVGGSARSWPARAPRAARYERTGSGLAWDAMDDGEDPTR
ncbi:Trp biosynthesis-associated membrane protein [Agrococcus sp. ProA11]|uniref:Trp biosynthesis-associated membrane protein n=1 Tax=Agrococcus chionoecetis TaxID=3153752 RepID=UPI00326028AC